MLGLRELPFWGPYRAVARPSRALARLFAAERDRWALWLPVCLGSGIAVYFALDTEPDFWIGPLAIIVAAAVGLAARHRPLGLVLAIAAATAALGLSLAQFRGHWVAEPVLEKRIGPVRVAGRLVAEEYREKGRRILLDRLTIQRIAPDRMPARIRITVRGMPDGARPGDRVTVRAILSPPPAPAAPGAGRILAALDSPAGPVAAALMTGKGRDR